VGKTLVTGAAGFIGSHVVRDLLAAGREVRAMLRPGEDTRNLDGLDVERVEGDLRDPDACHAAAQGCQRLFHLAAVYALWLPEPRLIYDVNVLGSQNMLWAARKADMERVVYTSSIAAVGVEPGQAPADEETPFNQVGNCNDYVFSKFLSDRLAMGFAREGLNLTVVCPAFPFGARDVGPTPTGKILLDVVQGRMPGYFDAGFNVIDVNDVARGHLLAEDKGRVGERYLLSNRNLTMQEFMELVLRVAGQRRRLVKLPLRTVTLLAHGLDWLADRRGKEPRISGKALRYASQNLYYDNTKARRELGLTFRPVEDSIRDALEWFQANGYLG
jgi:dihydroflavonol-4-reductase